jgi:hypothetical protein
MTECKEQWIISGRIFIPIVKKDFGGKNKDVDHIKDGYRGNKNHS